MKKTTQFLMIPAIASSMFLFGIHNAALAASPSNYVSSYSYETYSSGETITLSGESVEITEAGTYTLKGTLSDGQVLVNVGEDEEVTLILAGVNITSSDSAALYIESGKATITLQSGTTNYLTDGSSYNDQVDEEPNAALFAKEDLTINGTGKLVVDGNYNDGITTKDDLNIESGTIVVTAVDDGIRGKDSIDITGGTITTTSGGDSLKSDDEEEGTIDIDGGTINISSGDDGIKAYSVMTINDGTINITKSVEGLEAEQIILNGGEVNIVSSDDGINTTSSDDSSTVSEMAAQEGIMLTINGGDITVNASGDGLDSNGDIEMTGGTVIVYGPTNSGNGALDYNGTFEVSGGELIAVGASGMAMNISSSSSQDGVLINLTSSVSANSTFTIKDSSGTTIASVTSPKAFQSVSFSSDELSTGETYTYYVNGTQTGTFTVSSTTTQVGTSSSMGGGMGGFGGRGTMTQNTDGTMPTAPGGMGEMTDDQRAQFEQMRAIMDKQRNGETLTSEEQALLAEFETNRPTGMNGEMTPPNMGEMQNGAAPTTTSQTNSNGLSNAYKNKIDSVLSGFFASVSTRDTAEQKEIYETILERIDTLEGEYESRDYSTAQKQLISEIFSYFTDVFELALDDLN